MLVLNQFVRPRPTHQDDGCSPVFDALRVLHILSALQQGVPNKGFSCLMQLPPVMRGNQYQSHLLEA